MSALSAGQLDGYDQNDPLINSPFALVSTLNVALTYLVWYVAVTHWSLANYVSWVRHNDRLLGNQPNEKVYLTFVVIAEILLWGLGGPLFFYAAKYRKSQKDRNRMLFYGILTFFALSDIPLFALDLSISYFYGSRSVVQMTTTILRGISFFVSATLAWQLYVHRAVKFLQAKYESAEERERLAMQERKSAERKAAGIQAHNKMLRSLR